MRKPGTSPSVAGRVRITRGAFTLVEAVAVIVVISIAFPPMLVAIRQAHASRVLPARFSVARWLAAEKLEDIIADRHCTSLGYAHLSESNYPAEASISGYAGYSRAVAISETGPDLQTPGAGYKKVVVTVSFADGTGVTRVFPLATVLTEYEP